MGTATGDVDMGRTAADTATGVVGAETGTAMGEVDIGMTFDGGGGGLGAA
jgi:hypothetical protein